ncbi:MAG: pyroglutamyl-peptidase I [Clostridia bacterium]|nr:pyroglutamyl-peptidase I [Clostridia bacterium]
MAYRRLLVTGFEPFGGETVNPSWEAVTKLPERIGNCQITKLCLPVVFERAGQKALDAAETISADDILCVGQAGGRTGLTPEMFAVNLRYASSEDNIGQMPKDASIRSDGPAAYFSTMPVRNMANAIKDRSLPASVSYSAGTFVCNDLFYLLLHASAGTERRIGFVHVPFMTGQADAKVFSMPLEDIVSGLCACIEVIAV